MNDRLFRTINDLSGSPLVDGLMKASARFAIGGSFLVLAVLVLLRLRSRQVRPVLATGAGLAATFVLSLLLAHVHREARPFQSHAVHQLLAHAPGQSFPSDHATAAFGIALSVGVFLSWRWGVLLFLLGLLIGFARVYCGIHYPGDIAGGLLAALLGAGLVGLLDRGVRPSPGQHARPGQPTS